MAAREPTPRRRTLTRRAAVSAAAAVLTVRGKREAVAMSGDGGFTPAVQARLTEAMAEAVAEARTAGISFAALLLDAESGFTLYRAINLGDRRDPSGHAEVNALRGGGLAGLDLARTVLITTAESCPMCAACAVWAGVAGVAYGTSIPDLIRFGWGQIAIRQTEVVARSTFNRMPILCGVLREETDRLYAAGPPGR